MRIKFSWYIKDSKFHCLSCTGGSGSAPAGASMGEGANRIAKAMQYKRTGAGSPTAPATSVAAKGSDGSGPVPDKRSASEATSQPGSAGDARANVKAGKEGGAAKVRIARSHFLSLFLSRNFHPQAVLFTLS